MRAATRYVTINGETRSIVEWAKLTGISYFTLRSRIREGWSAEHILSPTDGRKAKLDRKPKAKPTPQSLFDALPALRDYQRDMHLAHRQMTRSIRLFTRDIERQMAELRNQLDRNLAAQHQQACRGVGQNKFKEACDRTHPVAQETV